MTRAKQADINWETELFASLFATRKLPYTSLGSLISKSEVLHTRRSGVHTLMMCHGIVTAQP